jgi:hypothetical protein
MKSVERGHMTAWDYSALSTLVAERGLQPALRLSVGQLRIATVPRVIRPDREGTPDPAWLTPLPATPEHTQETLPPSHRP